MSIITILYLTAIIFHSQCALVNNKDRTFDESSNLTTNADKRVGDKAVDKVYLVTNVIRVGKTATVLSRNKKWTPSWTGAVDMAVLPAARTDVIFRLQESKERRDKALLSEVQNYVPEEIWPAISFSMPKVTAYTFPSQPPTRTLAFRDHYSTQPFGFHLKYTPDLKFISSKYVLNSSHSGFGSPRGVPTFNNLLWKYNFLTSQPTWYAVYRTAPNPKLPGRTKNVSKEISNAASNDSQTIENILENIITIAATETPTTEATDADENYELPLRDLDSDSEREEKKKEKTIATTTTTTTRTTRTYPLPRWICYECGRNETKFGSKFCHNVFENKNRKENARKPSLRYRCNGNGSVAYGCFKRFLDVGYYNERGCRNWPPRRSGKTYASKRLRALEMALKNEKDGCIFTPEASLVSFSRTVQLYVRFHVCVCYGPLCNGVASRGPLLAVLLVSLFFYNVLLFVNK